MPQGKLPSGQIRMNRFLKPSDCDSFQLINGDIIIESDIEFDDLVNLMSKIEKERNVLGRSLHKEAFTGIDYLGNQVKFSSYAVWQENEDNFWQINKYQIYKFNFNPEWIPLDKEILRRSRDSKISKLTDESK
jgi:hypothetical protein